MGRSHTSCFLSLQTELDRKRGKEVDKPEKNTGYGHYIPSDFDIKAQDE